MLSDTHPDIEKIQTEQYRCLTGAQKIAQLRSLSSFVIELSRRGIAKANPHLDPSEVDILWVEMNYGNDLATRLRSYRKK